MKTNWKQWAAVGFLLAGGAYVAYLEMPLSDDARKKYDLDVYEKVGVGLLIAFLGAGIFSGLHKLKECIYPSSVETAALEEALVIAANHDHVINRLSLNQDSDSKENQLPDIPTAREDRLRVDKKHAELCNVLVKRYNHDCASGNAVNLRAFCQIADDYRRAYPTLNHLQYLAQLQTHGYAFSDIPKNLISKVITIKLIGRITPSTSGRATPDSAQPLTPEPLTPPKLQTAYSFTP